MPGPQAAQILQMSHPVTEESGKCPVIARGGKGTGRSSVELTGALCMYAAVDVDAIDVEVPYDMNFFVSQVCGFNALFNSSLGLIFPRGQSVSGHVIHVKM